ncbi:penicillin acylase family protein [Granulicella sp. WH15]|uniref:penicillin acylase family protein n=1 Tax=Granulicella sp. WH15 TaxID=2602070 RepID=UPI0013674E2F|nr:penicillin acylase family protein [Granulicella sp. WH15]QHN04437.1 penicillin acylase family protein [Granulicella sp. WH15]
MLPPEPNPQEPRLSTRRNPEDYAPLPTSGKKTKRLLLALPLLLLLAVAAIVGGHFYLQHSVRASLPQLDGSAPLPGLAAPVTIQRDAQGVPHIHAQSLDDMVLAQAWVTAHDRLWQMDMLRRHAAGELAAILGPSLLDHDKLQRTLQLRASADRAMATLPPDQLHLFTVYAQGVNAAIADQQAHLPIEFRVLNYHPAPWTPRDCLLVALVLFEDLTNNYQEKLDREALTARLPPELAADLFPVGSWRDHPPTQPPVDLTIDGPPIEQVPLDESQEGPFAANKLPPDRQQVLRSIQSDIDALSRPSCPDCIPGSNNWVVSGTHTASGKPLLANDMHLSHNIPGVWYEADLEAPIPGSEAFHAAGVTLPGLPLVIVGHNAHIAWGFTNLGADVQDLYLEQTRNNNQEFQSADGSWQPVLHLPEPITVHGGRDVNFEVLATKHGDAITPILTPTLTNETRPIALRWTIYDPNILRAPFQAIDSASDWSSFTAAIAQFGGPAQNMVYADDQGHIGYHATGRIPLRGQPAPAIPTDLAAPAQPTPAISAQTELAAPPTQPQTLSGPLNPVPVATSASHEWTGYIPFDQLPSVFDPPNGILATANARITPDDYPYPVTLNWGAPYRNERIWKLLAGRRNLKPADMLAIQTDVYSDLDHVLAQRIAYAVDHSAALAHEKSSNQAALHQAADLLRTWNGRVETNSAAANIVEATRAALWPILLGTHLTPGPPAPQTKTGAKADKPTDAELYSWNERDYALEQLIMHTPERWLPKGIANWDDLLASALDKGLADAHAPHHPKDLAAWSYGRTHVVDIEHPIFGHSRLLSRLLGMRTGTGSQPQSGDRTTIKQVGRAFGPSERFTADLANLDQSTLNIVLGESGNPASPYYMDQFPAWYRGTSFPFAFTDAAVAASTTHTLTLTPR